MPKFSTKFNQLIDFIKFTHEFREIIRTARTPYGTRNENDTEHSYQIAMLAWFLIEQDNLKLNKELCFMYALAHDLVEVYAGDTYIFDNKSKSSKIKRERTALKKIKKRFPKFKNLGHIIEKYEEKSDEESKFIYTLDKIVTPIQIYLEKGKLWHENNVSFTELVEYKNKKVATFPPVNKYWLEILNEITKNRKKLFPR